MKLYTVLVYALICIEC